MSTKSAYLRTPVRTAIARVGPKNNGAANGITIRLPSNTLLLRTVGASVTAFNGSGTVTITSTDGTTAFWSAVNVKDAAGFETVTTAPPKFYPNGATITTSIADANSNSTAGDAFIVYEYITFGEGGDIIE